MRLLILCLALVLMPPTAQGAAFPGEFQMRSHVLGAQLKGDFLSLDLRPAIDVPLRVNAPKTGHSAGATEAPLVRPKLRTDVLPRTRWQHRPMGRVWTRAALEALKAHGAPLVEMVPADIATWCPAYPDNGPRQRRAFWAGFLSALAKYESTYKATAVGGGGRWYGLLQILPGTARGYGCRARSGSELKSGAANLSCAIRIMAQTVPRDGVIHGPGGRGVAADWGPLHSKAKRAEMAGWLRRQNYCVPLDATRPRSRPDP